MRIQSEALVARAIAYGESDSIVTLITEAKGKLGVMVRGARKSWKRVGGSLEPFHTIEVTFDDKGGDLGVLREARIVRVRAKIVERLEALEAAGTALRWARHLFPVRTPEPEGWAALIELLEVLERAETPPRVALASAAMKLLAAVGYALELEQCVQCGRPCPETRPAYIEPARGGIVCRACGGGSRLDGTSEAQPRRGQHLIEPELRSVARGLQGGDGPAATDAQAADILALVEDAMAAHAGYDPTRKGGA